MKRLNPFSIFVSFLLFTATLKAADPIPKYLLKNKFSIQVKWVDSTMFQISKRRDISFTRKQGDEYASYALNHNDKQFSLLLRLYTEKEIMNNQEPDSSECNAFTNIIKESANEHLPYIVAEANQLLGFFYWNTLQNYTLGLEHCFIAESIYENFTLDEFPNKAEFMYDFGGKYYHFRDFNAAKQIYLKVWNTVPEEKIRDRASKMNTLALCYRSLQKYDSAIYYFNKAQLLAKKYNDHKWFGILSGNIGDTYMRMKQYDRAYPLLETNIEEARKNNMLNDLGQSLALMGWLMVIKGENEKALKYAEEAYKIMNKKRMFTNTKYVSQLYANLAKVYAANNKMDLAYRFLDSGAIAKDSVNQNSNLLFLSGIQQKQEIEKHRSEIDNKESEIENQKFISNIILVGLAIVLVFALVLFNRFRITKKQKQIIEIQKASVEREKHRSEELLLNILPQEVAEELKKTGQAQAKNFEAVTVMFTDFKGFSTIAEKMQPAELVSELHHCFSKFDKLCHKYGLEKIKTIGDSYMAVSGLPIQSEENAVEAVRAAIAIRNFMNKYNKEKLAEGKNVFEIRIGIHSGPVTAGIVGVKKFAYDIWGDTVNTASRMESGGEEGKVNISETTYELVKKYFSCTFRGKLPVKNKGEIGMYFVEKNNSVSITD